MNPKDLCNLIQFEKSILTEDLLKPNWKKQNIASGIRTTGHCYAASEALYYLLGGREGSDYQPRRVKLKNGNHWFLKNKETNEILDPTSTQFPLGIDYSKSIGCGFMQQSNRSKIIIDRVNKLQS